MKITGIKISKIENANTVLATASIGFDNELVVTGFKIMRGKHGLFLSMPSVKRDKPDSKGNSYRDTTFCLTKDFKAYLSVYVIKQFNGDGVPEFDLDNQEQLSF